VRIRPVVRGVPVGCGFGSAPANVRVMGHGLVAIVVSSLQQVANASVTMRG